MFSFTDFTAESDLDDLQSKLDEYGVAVLPEVFKKDECDEFRNKVWSKLCQKHDIKNIKDYMAKINPIHGGLIHSNGVSLYSEVLDLKTDERAIEPFRRIWNEKELTVSLDGLYIGPPAEQTGYFFNPDRLIHGESFHTDQASTKKTKCCVQSFITLESIESGDGCLSVLTNSHKYHAEFFEHFNLKVNFDWFVLSEKHLKWFIEEKKCKWNTILAPKGSMIFWDSRTIHMATLPRRNRLNKDRWRFLVYVCYTPASLQTEKDTLIKRKCYENNEMTTHWPYGVQSLGKTDCVTNDLSNLTDRHKKFIGI